MLIASADKRFDACLARFARVSHRGRMRLERDKSVESSSSSSSSSEDEEELDLALPLSQVDAELAELRMAWAATDEKDKALYVHLLSLRVHNKGRKKASDTALGRCRCGLAEAWCAKYLWPRTMRFAYSSHEGVMNINRLAKEYLPSRGTLL